ncbi:MAG: hypothetical protein C0598_04840 [Marinilabiliales bacterium]|nr:MAG: hypothetical protein C0598_04840 [Marinilabiliales bacterium]
MRRLYIIVLLIFAAIISEAQTDTITMEEILIVSKQNLKNTNIDGKTIELENPHDGGAMFKNQLGFGIEKKGNYGMEPVLRGFKFGQLNIQIDGGIHSANACPNRMDPAISQISPEEIEKIEVIKGPYNVRFGPSFGGVINIVSKRPQKVDGKTVSASLDAGYQSNGNNIYSNLFTQVVKNKYDFSVNASYKDYGNYESGSGEEIPSSFNRWGFTVKGGINIKDNQRLQISFRHSKASDILYAGLPMDADFDKSTIASLDYGVYNISKSISHLKLKIYSSFVDHEMSTRNRMSWMMVEGVAPVQAQVYGGRAEFLINTTKKNKFYVGTDFRQIAKQGNRDRLVKINGCTGDTLPQPKAFVDKIWQDSKKNNLGVFVENKYQISKSLFWLAAFRIDYVTYSIKDPENDFKEQYNGDIQPDAMILPSVTTNLSWYSDDGFNLQWALAMAHRSPEISEMFINHLSIGMDAYEYLGNPNLKSETNYQTDLRIEKSWKNISIYGDVFYSYITNYINAKLDTTIAKKFMPCNPPKGTKVFTNVDEVYMTGFEIGADFNFLNHFTYTAGASYTYAQNISWDEPLAEIPPFTFNTSLVYKTERINTRIHARFAMEQDRVSTSFAESVTPGFTVVDFNLSYNIAKFVSINGSVTNLLDENYVEHLSRSYKNMGPDTGSLYYEAGRSFNIGIRFNF